MNNSIKFHSTLIKQILLSLILFFLLNESMYSQSEIFMATNGDDNATGLCDDPVATLSGAVARSEETGAKTIWIREGKYAYDKRTDLRAKHSGLKISGYGDEKVVFDGGVFIKGTKFKKLGHNVSGRVKNSMVGKIYFVNIQDPEQINLLKDAKTLLSFNDTPMNIARFPNEGFAVFRKEQVILGNETVHTSGTHDNPKGPVFKLREKTYNIDAWEKEINRHKKTTKVNGNYLRTVNGTRYGIEGRKENRLKKAYFSNILFELDSPGEWFFDEIDNKLFFYPTADVTPESEITLWAGIELIHLENANNITIENFQVQHIGKTRTKNGDGVIALRGHCDNVKVAGIVFRNIANMYHEKL